VLTTATVAHVSRLSTMVLVVEVETDNLIDQRQVAALIGLGNERGVSVYRRRYPDFPKPAIDRGHCVLWVRGDVEAWAREAGRLK
jgi:predicted DNA-binding transcriptional regulator AlpA